MSSSRDIELMSLGSNAMGGNEKRTSDVGAGVDVDEDEDAGLCAGAAEDDDCGSGGSDD